MTKAQTASLDALIAVALFTIVLIFFFGLSLRDSGKAKVENLQADSGKLTTSVGGRQNQTSSFVANSKIDEQKIAELSNMSYEQLKNFLGIDSDFCLYFEDSQGNIINFSGNKTGRGSSNATVAGVSCS